MDTKKLRQKILDLAIRGKLVPQNPNDEPASVLLERIRAEKERLIKEGKIKRSKKSASDTPHYENRQVGEANEVPFEVPESWEWTTLGEITNYGNCENVDVNDIPSKGWILELEDLEKDSAKIIQRLTKDERDIKGVRHSFHKGDVLYSKLRTYLNKVLVADEDGFCTTEIIPVTSMASVLPEYLNYVLRSKYFVDYTVQCGYGVKMPRLSTTDACNGQIPLPPYNEQKHIVASIEGWFQIIDLLETAKEDLQTSITQAKSKILDLAIHGKLVPQDPNDEPAIELLKRINPKFVPCDNAHYENLPSNWTAILLGDLCFTINGLWKGKKPPFVHVGVIRNANFTKDCKLDYSNIAYLEVEVKQYEKRKLQYGDIIVEKSGGSDNQPVGRTILFEKTEGDYSFSNFTSILRIYDGYPALPEYLNMYLQVVYQTGITKRMQTQTTGIHNLIFDQFLAIPIKLPPLAEQRRIINKVSKLSQILDNISAEL